MGKAQAVVIYLILIIAIVPVAAVISWYRSGMGMFDPVLALGLTAFTFLNIMKTLGVAVGFNIVLGYLFAKLWRILIWIPVAAVLAVIAHHLASPYYGLMGVGEMGVLDAYLMYLPFVALFTLLGGLLAALFSRQAVRATSEPA